MEKQLLIHVSSEIKEPLKEGDEFLISYNLKGDPQAVCDMLFTLMSSQFEKGKAELASIVVAAAEEFKKKYPDVLEEN